MARRKRDYKAEYARRIERGRSEGLSRSQARGHPRHHEPYAAEIATVRPWDPDLEIGLGHIREGRSMAAAARSIGVAPERLRSYVTRTGVARKEKRRWRIGPDYRQRQVLIHSKGQDLTIVVPGFAEASAVNRYMAGVRWFIHTNDAAHLAEFAGQGVTDVDGVFHPFEVRENVLYRLNETASETFEQVYQIVA
jgi:hypothetical protein